MTIYALTVYYSVVTLSKKTEKIKLRTISSVSVWRGRETIWVVRKMLNGNLLCGLEASYVDQPSIGQNYLPLCIPYDRNEAG